MALGVVVCVVLGSLGLVAGISAGVSVGSTGGHTSTSAGVSTTTASTGTPSRSPTGIAKALALEDAMRAKGISPGTVHFPNFAGAVTDTAQPIQPSYAQAPAPLGVADIGLENRSGVLVPYSLNTTSVAGTVNITNLQSLYLDGDGPDTYGIQLNSVVNGVTVFGNSSYEFWSQNYVDYTISTQQLVFGDEVWNFSSPSGLFPTSSVYGFSPNGTFGDFPFLYQGYGPAITIGYPFALTLYLNTSTIADRPALYFNYTLSNDTFRQSSSFDYLIFNSTVGTPSTAAETPYYQADGYNYDPIGLINDMEIDILGNDNGDTTAFLAADATISLQYWNASAGKMQEVPSAYNAGQETGETSVGLLVYSSGGSNPIGLVRNGPALVGGLWNYSATSGAVADTVTVHPVAEYSFLFVNTGMVEDDSTAQWVPTSITGTTTFYLPTGGTYFLDFLMNEYRPVSEVITATASVTLPAVHLAVDVALGVYTPLFAFDNGELAAISAPGGAGTEANPYVIVDNNQYGTLAPQFASWDDYLFPVFPGLLIAGTSAWADLTPPSFEINLPSWDFGAAYIAALGLPLTNDLQLQFYNASNISLVHAAGISGWMSSFLFGFPESSVMMWNCTNMLVASNTFDDQGNALLLYGGANNTVWGNSFLPTPVAAADPASVDDSGWISGVNETESGDLVYNNFFEVAIPAITPTTDPFQCDQYGYCNTVAYSDAWNVSDQPAANYTIVDGWNLTGSIIGTWYEGGNFWSNYGTSGNPFGVLPYNNSGAIAVGGDYVPLVPFSLYAVSFNQTGLTSATPWNVTALGVTTSNTSSGLVLWAPNGTYDYSLPSPAGYLSSGSGNFTVNGGPIVVNVSFAPLEPVTFVESGLVPGWTWTVTVPEPNGSVLTTPGTNGSSILLELPGGTTPVSYSGSAAANGYDRPAWATQVGMSPVTVPVVFTVTEVVLFLEHGLPTGTAWSVHLVQGNYSTSVSSGNSSIVFTTLDASRGPLNYSVSAADFTASPSHGSYDSTELATITIDFAPMNGTLWVQVSPAGAAASVNGRSVALASGGTATLSLAPGIYTVEVTNSGYLAYYNNVSVTSASNTSLAVVLTSIPAAPATGVSSAAWAAIGLLAALAVVLLLVTLGYRSRARRPPPKEIEPAAGPTPSVPASSEEAAPPAPWVEK
ncbi:MAG: thermopsin family protease [Thermoplasmata archaeon]